MSDLDTRIDRIDAEIVKRRAHYLLALDACRSEQREYDEERIDELLDLRLAALRGPFTATETTG